MKERTSSVPLPASLEASAGAVRSVAAIGVRDALLVTLLLVTPVLAYGLSIFQTYEMRDGYSVLREAHEEPGKIVRFCSSHARPIYGWLLDTSYRHISTVADMQWMRLLSVLMLGVFSAVTFRGLCLLGWSTGMSLLVGLLVSLVPSAQVIAGWSIGWPYTVAAMLAMLAFFAAENGLAADRRSRKAAAWIGTAGLCLVASLLIYQSSTLFYAVPMAAAFLARRDLPISRLLRWAGAHLALLAIALGLAYGIMNVLYTAGVFPRSTRVAFEQDWLAKLAWLVREPLPNALNLYTLNDENHRWHPAYLVGTAVGTLVLAGGLALEWAQRGWRRALLWTVALLGFALLGFAISMVASERYATYRTAWALTGVLLVFLVSSAAAITASLTHRTRLVLGCGALIAAVATAHYHVYHLMAIPQGNEWQLIVDGARKVDPLRGGTRIHVVIPTLADTSTDLLYHDEFGSLSSNSEWVPREMFKRAMHDLHPHDEDVNASSRYTITSGRALPPGAQADVVIDMHRLRTLRPRD